MPTIAEYLEKRIKARRSHNQSDELPERLRPKRSNDDGEKVQSSHNRRVELPERLKPLDEKKDFAIRRLAKHLNVDHSKLGELLKDAIDELNTPADE